MEQERHSPGNPDLLRKDINSGRTAEKVAFPDPAAAPLGADDEAAGAPPAPAAVEEARRAERAPPGLAHTSPVKTDYRLLLIYAAAILVFATVIVLGALRGT